MLDLVIHQATRLQILALLLKNREIAFHALRDALGLTDGNLGTHAAKLIEAGYVESKRVLTPTGFEQRYRLTPRGEQALLAYVAELQSLLGFK